MQKTIEDIEEIERIASHNNGRCPHCGQAIKSYRYKINKSHAQFMRAMAKEVRNLGVNDVDISNLGLAYSIRSQVTKLRQHGLIARVKNDKGAQTARHWLITHKGYDFVNGQPIYEKVIVYNNQVLGHEGNQVTIHEVLGEGFNPEEPLYEEEAVTQAEARTYQDVRTPQKYSIVSAIFKGRDYMGRFKVSQTYRLQIKRLQVGKPVEITGIDAKPFNKVYTDLAGFIKDWKIIS